MPTKLTESHLRSIIKTELKKLLREFDTDWVYDYECDELPQLLNDLESGNRQFGSKMEKDFAIRIVKDRMETCSEG